jgi:hypothetical protein
VLAISESQVTSMTRFSGKCLSACFGLPRKITDPGDPERQVRVAAK